MIEIKKRITGEVLFRSEKAESIREAVVEAVAARANLADANLAGANLAGANLAGANLAGANLAGANLAGANLADAYLAGANLAGANLAGANLAGANLAGADLAGANLARANLADAYLADAYLAGADLADANLARADLADADLADADLARADLAGARNVPAGVTSTDPEKPYERAHHDYAARARRYREHHPDVPVVERLDQKILESVTSGGGALEMKDWHTCETTHCRGGWAVHHAGEAGYALEQKYGNERAAVMIYRASVGRVPYFYDSNEGALASIKEWASDAEKAAEPAL